MSVILLKNQVIQKRKINWTKCEKIMKIRKLQKTCKFIKIFYFLKSLEYKNILIKIYQNFNEIDEKIVNLLKSQVFEKTCTNKNVFMK